MANARLKHLESELVRVAKELSEHTHSPAYAVPFRGKSGKMFYVVVGPRNAIHGILARTKIE